MHEDSNELLIELSALAERRRGSESDDAIFAARYFLVWQIARHGRRFAARKCRSDERPNAEEWLTLLAAPETEALRSRLIDGLGRYQFLDVIGSVPTALLRWL